MRETVAVSSRGRITLPAALRKRLGLKAGDVLTLEDCGSEIVLKPDITEHCRNEEIAAWDKADRLSERERARVLAAL